MTFTGWPAVRQEMYRALQAAGVRTKLSAEDQRAELLEAASGLRQVAHDIARHDGYHDLIAELERLADILGNLADDLS